MHRNTPNTRVFELDILRFLAALAVVLYHLTYRQIDDHTLFEQIDSVTRFGYLGVHLFFMISGFVILWTAVGRTPTQFIISRFSRLYPIFWASIGITLLGILLIQGQSFDIFRIFANMTMIAGYMGEDYIDSVYWTLQVELKFYFLVFILIVLKQINNIDYWLAGWLAGCIAAPYIPGLPSLVIYPYGAYFIAGATIYLIWKDRLTPARGAMLFICLVLSLIESVNAVPKFLFEQSSHHMITSPLIITVFYILMLAIALGHVRIGERPFLFKLAMMTYPLYLLHNNLGKMIFDSLDANKFPSLIIVLVLLFILCYVLATYVDKPLNRLSNKKLNELLHRWTDK